MKTYKLSYYVLYALEAVIVVVLLMYFLGGEATGAARMANIDPELSQPANTDALIYLTYGLVGLCVFVTVAAFIAQFASAFKDSPKKALGSLVGFILLVLLLVVTWSMGSTEPLVMPGYDGTENVPFWLRLTDMFIYSIYFLMGMTVLLIIAGSVKKALGK